MPSKNHLAFPTASPDRNHTPTAATSHFRVESFRVERRQTLTDTDSVMALSRRSNPLLSVFGLVLATLLLTAGCDTGSRGGPAGPPPVIPPSVDVSSLNPDEGPAGTVITISGHGFNLDPSLNEVIFDQSGGPAEIPGQVLTVSDGGVDEFGRTITTMTVLVPTGVRTSSVEVSSFDGTDFVFAGSQDFLATPVITSIVYGTANAGFHTIDVTNATQGDLDLFVYGYNLNSVIGANAVDESGMAVAVLFAPGSGGGPTPPPGMSAATITVPDGTDIALPNCVESGWLEIEVLTAGNGAAPLAANKFRAKFRKVFPTGDQEDLHGSITNLLVPSGVRSGLIECQYNVHAEADGSSARFFVMPQYLDAAGTFQDCTIVGGPIRALSGGSAQNNPLGSLPGVGHPGTFLWDSGLDLAGFEGATELRIRLMQDGNTFLCGQPLSGEIFSAPIAISNTGIVGGMGSGAVTESFDTERFRDSATDAGVWTLGAGELVGVGHPTTTPSPFGTGTVDVVLDANIAYTIDTDAGIILVDDITLGLPTPLTDADNPGALIGELHVRTLTIDAAATVTVIGDNPVIFRVAGTGIPTDTVVQIDGVIDLSGAPGTAGTDNMPGVGGIGIAGGFDGGNGAHAMAGGQGIAAIDLATDGGGPGGGEAGTSTSWLSQSIPTGRGGPAGGAGHATPGEDGTNSDPSNSIAKAQPGRGGSAYGDSRLVHLTAGSGGGGGGTGIRFVPTSMTISDKTGGGGGAGGGAIEIAADGVVDINGSILCDGGVGGDGAAGPYGGQGGPGSGGAIAIRASSGLRIASTAFLSARGRPGTENNGNSQSFKSGASADGRIHLESNGPFNFAGFNSLAGLLPTIADSAVDTGINVLPVNVGTGMDGPLNLGSEAPGTTWIISTGATPSDFARVFDSTGTVVTTASQPGGILELTSLTVPEDVTLRGLGMNPLIIRVTGGASIEGIIDVSGSPGGLVDTSGASPLPGLGGMGGPGGGRGGDGGVADGTVNTPGGDGGFPIDLPGDLVASPPYSSGGGTTGSPVSAPDAMPATGGQNIVNGAVNDFPTGGGGGGFAKMGLVGSSSSGVSPVPFGQGGGTYLSNDFVHPVTFEPLLIGGGGGAGGGGSNFPDPPLTHSPGTGGGGGGGFLQISVGGFFNLTSTAQLLARGGDSFRGPQFGANGGAGAGGAIRLQGLGVLRVDGAMINALGGTPDRPVAEHPDQSQVANANYLENAGTIGGQGGSGRIQIESPLGLNADPPTTCGDATTAGICPPASVGAFLLADAGVSTAETETYPVGVENGAVPGFPVFSSILQTPGFSPESAPTVLSFVRGASEDPAAPGTMTEFTPWTDDPSALRNASYLQMKHILIGAPTPGGGVTQPTLEEVELLFDY